MKRQTRTILIAGSVVALMGGGLAASALWNTGVGVDVPDVAIGAVRFGAAPQDAPEQRAFSAGGEAVQLTLPGSALVEAAERAASGTGSVVWRFVASGSALGITGLNYDVAATAQIVAGASHDLSTGVAQPGTVLERSTLKIYRAGAGSDCSAIPATPDLGGGETPKNVIVYDAVDVELQAAGAALDGAESAQEWCVALDGTGIVSGTYINDVQVTGTGEDGTPNGATDRWHSQVGARQTPDGLGIYRNRVTVEATTEDTTHARASAEWNADVDPGPSEEPDIVIALDPIVTNVNPAVDPRD